MVKVNELRLNNLFVQAGSNFVETVTFETFELLSRGAIKVVGIPLTEEWLLKLGFEKCGDDGEYFSISQFPFELLNQGDSFSVFDTGGLKVANIKCVHQLQNLYFALTENELQINL